MPGTAASQQDPGCGQFRIPLDLSVIFQLCLLSQPKNKASSWGETGAGLWTTLE
ncbi:hypothetical protein [Roseovarius lutimaris]|uniref:hypothetical protein n=1 Tax=Roseovarius lutimaris TaxID=1005928 RepID=UPI0015A6FB31|nr:hypothetical protein [Roseovarius lutimaris]